MIKEFRGPIQNEMDVSIAVIQARDLASSVGFDDGGATMIATSVSELGRNIVKYAGRGEIAICPVQRAGAGGITIVASDHGPGIANVAEAMEDHFSSGGTLGLGLPGVRRMMDEFELQSQPGQGTQVTVCKWL